MLQIDHKSYLENEKKIRKVVNLKKFENPQIILYCHNVSDTSTIIITKMGCEYVKHDILRIVTPKISGS